MSDLELNKISIRNFIRILILSLMIACTISQECFQQQPMLDAQSSKALKCDSKCELFDVNYQCLSCKNSQLKFENGTCFFCPIGQYLNPETDQCEECLNTFNEKTICLDQNFTIQCPQNQMINLDKLQCVQYCDSGEDVVTITTHAYHQQSFSYCRGQQIYVNPYSKEYLELGTQQYPYKSIVPALIELFNYLPVESKEYKVLIKENTTDIVQTLFGQLLILNALNVTIKTYSENDNQQTSNAQSTLYFQPQSFYSIPSATRFTIINETQNFESKLTSNRLSQNEVTILSQRADLIVVRSNLNLLNLKITNERTQANEDERFLFLWDIQDKKITLNNLYIDFYGKIMRSFNPLNIEISNTIVRTEYLTEGIILNSDCSQTQKNSYKGNITFQNFTLYGERYNTKSLPSIQITSLYNMTFNNITLFTYSRIDDPNKFVFQVDSTSLCPFSADNLTRVIQFSNIYVSSTAKTRDSIVSVSVNFVPKSDLGKRSPQGICENITAENFYSENTFLALPAGNINFTIKNFMQNNVSLGQNQAFHLATSGTQTLLMKNLTIQNCATSSRIVLCFLVFQQSIIDGLTIVNSSLEQTKNGFCMIKGASMTSMSTQTFNNLYFANNNIYSNQMFQQDQNIRKFVIKNAVFKNETMKSQTSYVTNLKSQSLQLYNVTFDTFYYNDSIKFGSFVVRYDEYNLQSNTSETSQFQNVTVKNCETNFFLFKGYRYIKITNPLDMFYFDFIRLTLTNNTFGKTSTLIQIDQFQDLNPTQIRIMDSLFQHNYFEAGGNLVLALQNTLYPMLIKNTTFYNNTKAQINLMAGDRQNKSIPLKLQIESCNFTQNNPLIDAMFKVQTNSELYISNSLFNQIYSLSRGGIILADFQNVKVYVNNSTFVNNFAADGGIFFAHFSSYVAFDSCIFRNNYAILGGIGRLENQGYFSMKNSTVIGNHAVKASIFAIQDSIDNLSIIENTILQDNDALNIEMIADNIDPKIALMMQKDHSHLFNSDLQTSEYVISLNKGQLLISSNSQVLSTNNFINAYVSNLIISQTQFLDIRIFNNDNSFITATSSSIQIVNTIFSNFTYEDEENIYHQNYIVQCNLDSNLKFLNTSLIDSRVQFIWSVNSQLILSSLLISNIKLQGSTDRLIKVDNVDLVIEKSSFTNIQGTGQMINEIRRSEEVQIQSSLFQYFASNLFDFELSTINVNNSTFQTLYCYYEITNNSFVGNVASLKGGSISYNKYSPQVFINNYFDSSNYAPYNPQMSGYPYGVRVVSIDQYPIASGQKYQGQIVVEVVDAQKNRINIDNQTNINIVAFDKNSKVSAKNQIQVENGIGIFDQLEFQAKPGIKNVKFLLYSSSINSDQLRNVFDDSQISFKINQDFIALDFRLCLPGEINYFDQCVVCGVGYYSFDGSLSECKECPHYSECPGGQEIYVYQGYWRSSFHSTKIIECLNSDSCIGGTLSQNYSNYDNPLSYPLCQMGYGGNLCDHCINVDGLQFTRIAKNECGLCPDKIGNILKISGILIALLMAFAILLWVNLRTNKESETSVIIRILLNYVQIFTSAAAFNLNWPKYLKAFFEAFSQAGDIAISFVSFDCFLSDTGFLDKHSSPIYLKTLVVALFPIGMIIFFSLMFYFLKFIRDYSYKEFIRQVIVSAVVILYSLHPTISRMIGGLFFCMEIDDNEYWLQTDLEIKCWQGQHLIWSLGIGLPSIIVWIIGVPVIGFLYLYKKRKQLDNITIFERYRMMYQGLKQEYFYWEFVNILRKTFLISVNVFLNLYSNIFKALLSLLILMIFLRLQIRVQPYKNPMINVLEYREYMISIITFFLALFFINKEFSDEIQLTAFVLIILANCYFFILWIFCLTFSLNFQFSKKLAHFFARFILTSELKEKLNVYLISKARTNQRGGINNEDFMTDLFNLNKLDATADKTLMVQNQTEGEYGSRNNTKTQKIQQKTKSLMNMRSGSSIFEYLSEKKQTSFHHKRHKKGKQSIMVKKVFKASSKNIQGDQDTRTKQLDNLPNQSPLFINAKLKQINQFYASSHHVQIEEEMNQLDEGLEHHFNINQSKRKSNLQMKMAKNKYATELQLAQHQQHDFTQISAEPQLSSQNNGLQLLKQSPQQIHLFSPVLKQEIIQGRAANLSISKDLVVDDSSIDDFADQLKSHSQDQNDDAKNQSIQDNQIFRHVEKGFIKKIFKNANARNRNSQHLKNNIVRDTFKSRYFGGDIQKQQNFQAIAEKSSIVSIIQSSRNKHKVSNSNPKMASKSKFTEDRIEEN